MDIPITKASRARRAVPSVSEPMAEALPVSPAEHAFAAPITNQPPRRMKFLRLLTRRNIFIFLFIVLLVGFVYYFVQYQKLSQSPADIAKEKTEAAVKEISQFVVLPEDPDVQLATVTDVSKLKGQPFFENAQNGDQILVFPNAMEAILYRPSLHKIVDISRLSSTSAAPSKTASSTPKK